MIRLRLAGIYEWGLVVILFLVVLHAPISVGFGSAFPEYASLIKAWKEIVLGILAVAAVALLTRHGLWQKFCKDSLIQLSAAYLLLHLMLIAILRGDVESIASGLLIDLRYIGMFVLVYVLVLIRPDSVRRVVKAVAAGALVVLGFGLLQITVLPDGILRGIGYSKQTITPYTTIDSNPDYVRINSTLRGPNPLGALAVVYGTLAVAYFATRPRGDTRKKIMAATAFSASTAVLFSSYSRSAYIGLLVAIGVIMVGVKRISRRAVLIGAATAVMFGIGLWQVSHTDWYANVVLHEDPESTVVSKSNEGHIESFLMGANRMAMQPFGAGIGSTGSASLYDDDATNDTIIENSYFYIAHESGWLGLAIFMTLFVVILQRLWRLRSSWLAMGVFASGLGLAVIGLLLPVWADETVALTWWALAGAVAASTSGIIGGRHGKRTRKQTPAGTS